LEQQWILETRFDRRFPHVSKLIAWVE
jgi:hypothetical protein